MKTSLPRSAFPVLLLTAMALSSGCASLVDGLNEVAYQLEQERLRQEQQAYYDAYCLPRRSSDTSAMGIK
jgi:hypothetical protein